jgi:hypothetical protein
MKSGFEQKLLVERPVASPVPQWSQKGSSIQIFSLSKRSHDLSDDGTLSKEAVVNAGQFLRCKKCHGRPLESKWKHEECDSPKRFYTQAVAKHARYSKYSYSSPHTHTLYFKITFNIILPTVPTINPESRAYRIPITLFPLTASLNTTWA